MLKEEQAKEILVKHNMKFEKSSYLLSPNKQSMWYTKIVKVGLIFFNEHEPHFAKRNNAIAITLIMPE